MRQPNSPSRELRSPWREPPRRSLHPARSAARPSSVTARRGLAEPVALTVPLHCPPPGGRGNSREATPSGRTADSGRTASSRNRSPLPPPASQLSSFAGRNSEPIPIGRRWRTPPMIGRPRANSRTRVAHAHLAPSFHRCGVICVLLFQLVFHCPLPGDVKPPQRSTMYLPTCNCLVILQKYLAVC